MPLAPSVSPRIRRVHALLAALAALAAPALAHAQHPPATPQPAWQQVSPSEGATAVTASAVCAEGRVVGPATVGRCCWPGQHWSEPYGRCEGPPQCPPGFAGDGDQCVRAAPRLPPPPPAPPPRIFRRRYHGGPIPRGAHVEDEPLGLLAWSGARLTITAYLSTLPLGLVGVLSHDPCDEPLAWGLLPVVGPLGSLISANATTSRCFASSSRDFSVGLLLVSGGFQVLGAAIAAGAYLFPDRWLVYDRDAPQARRRGSAWQWAPVLTSSSAGVAVGGAF
jgi:hypothetical protein